MGRGFEQAAASGEARDIPFRMGICSAAARYFRMPAYLTPGARVSSLDPHGWYLSLYSSDVDHKRRAALHRAMTCYLVAEMVMDGRAPEFTDVTEHRA
jgi:hypothetical protein